MIIEINIYTRVCVFSGTLRREWAVEKWPIHVLERSTQHSNTKKLARRGCKRDVCNLHTRRSISSVDSKDDDDDDDDNNDDAVYIFK